MIRELFQKGWTKTAIAEATGFDRKTVSKYLKDNQLPKRKGSKQKKESKLDPYKPYILGRLKEGTINCVVLLEEIQAMGYEGQLTILRDFVRPLRQQPKKQATLRFETPPGVGKTHLAISFAVEAITKGYTALFLTSDNLVDQCRKAKEKGTLHRLVNRWSRPDILIIDEVGYFPFDELTANIFFQVVSKRYEKGAMVLTSNKSYLEWGNVFGDEVLATAILDRLLHHALTFNIKGDSYRLREKKKAGIYPAKLTT